MRLAPAFPALLAVLGSPACAGAFVEPTEGDYDVEVRDFAMSESCEGRWEEEADLDGLRKLDLVEIAIDKASGAMTIDEQLECQITGDAFECGSKDAEVLEKISKLVMHTTKVAEGRFNKSKAFESDWEVLFELLCDGVPCEGGALPCDVSYTLEGVFGA